MLLQENILKINRKTYKTENLRGLRSFAAVILYHLHDYVTNLQLLTCFMNSSAGTIMRRVGTELTRRLAC